MFQYMRSPCLACHGKAPKCILLAIHMELLKSTPNQFSGLIIEPDALPGDPELFRAALAASIPIWRAQGAKVAWLELGLARAALVPAAVGLGFVYHHAAADRLQLTLTLIEGSHIPPYASHYVGAGGAVIDTERRLLVVCERYRRGPGKHYKLPGGALHEGEHIAEAVRREILEETGIDTAFQGLVCFRHWHGYRHGKSDIYFVCRMRPLSSTIAFDTEEIAECLWMPVDEFLGREDVHAFNKRIVRAALDSTGLVPTVIEGYGTPETHEIMLPGAGPAR